MADKTYSKLMGGSSLQIMNSSKIKKFMKLAGQEVSGSFSEGDLAKRKLGAQLLLSETLEYVIKGLGIVPEFQGTAISEPDQLNYRGGPQGVDQLEMIDGLADVAYTMYWNAEAFGLPLEESFELVCNNNLEKFVLLKNWSQKEGPLEREEWSCQQNVEWPPEVVQVEVLEIDNNFYAVGKDRSGKVRKPAHFKAVDLRELLSQNLKSCRN